MAQTDREQASEGSGACLGLAKGVAPVDSMSAVGMEWSCSLQLQEMSSSCWGICPVPRPHAGFSGVKRQALRHFGVDCGSMTGHVL